MRRTGNMARRETKRKNGRPAAGKLNGRGAEAVDYGPLADWVGFNLRMAQAAAFQAFSRRAQEVGTRPGRFATLMLIGRNPGISQTALSRANGRDKSSLTPVLIRRRRTRADQRAYRLSLTPAGKSLLAQLVRCARSHERNLDRIIGGRAQKSFVRILKRIIAQAG
jgi:DNA-binding MarR family transcriptional regulator